MVTVAFSRDTDPEANTWGDIVRQSNSNNILRPDLHVWVLDGCHRFQMLHELLRESSDISRRAMCKWVSNPLRLDVVRRKHGVTFSPFETIKLNCRSGLLTGIVLGDNKFFDVMHFVLFYADTFQEEYQTPFSDAPSITKGVLIHI